MKRLKLIVSDFHVGKGVRLEDGGINPFEDFNLDHKFREMLDYYSSGHFADHEVELIFNGDMLNLIQVDYFGHFTTVITENVSEEKVRSVIEGHPIFFGAIKRFLANPKHSMTYVIGNHDQEMMWEKSKRLFEKGVGCPIKWKHTYYLVDGVHIEHGHQYEAANRVDPTRPFLNTNLPEPIVNLPWGTLFTVQYLIRLKRAKPYIDKIRPFRQMLIASLMQNTLSTIGDLFKLIAYFISTRFSKNRYRHSSLTQTMKILMESTVFPDLGDAAKRILGTESIHTVVFGHSHVYRHQIFGEGKQYLNTGTWIDVVSLDLETYARRSKLTYVRIEYDEKFEKPAAKLRHWIGRIPIEDDAMVA